MKKNKIKFFLKWFPLFTTIFSIFFANSSEAAVYFFNDFESKTCDTMIADAERVENVMWDTYSGNPEPYSRCSLSSPSGINYVEWHAINATNAEADLYPNYPNSSFNLNFNSTYYLAGFFRFQRVNSLDIWRDTGSYPYQFDKLIEFRGSGFRWGIGSGWNGGYSIGGDHKFTFDAWYATSILGNHGPDHIIADQVPYGINDPFLCDYDKWYAVVLGVTVQNSENGRVQLWINGSKIIDQAHYTANLNATFGNAIVNGTIAQPNYDSPEHFRQMDRLIITDLWADIQGGGYLQDPNQSPDTTPPAAPSGVTII